MCKMFLSEHLPPGQIKFILYLILQSYDVKKLIHNFHQSLNTKTAQMTFVLNDTILLLFTVY